ncbi:hypothetical protein HDV00_010148 [Rhizophlyctis rosea]|nr:hypothetical protein HDV00_010148 [Rhizophlyctis rosea]
MEIFCPFLLKLHHLDSLMFDGEYEKSFCCKDISSILRCIPGRLEKFHIRVRDWNHEEVRAGLAEQSGLKEVIIHTVEFVEVEREEGDSFVGEYVGDEKSYFFLKWRGTYTSSFDIQARSVSEELRIPKVHFDGPVSFVTQPW